MEKRGQISIFIILGLTILILVSFMLFLSGKSSKRQIETSVTETFTKGPEMQDIETHLDLALSEAVVRGLVIWQNSGGLDTDQVPSRLQKSYDNRNIAYLSVTGYSNLFDKDLARTHLESIISSLFRSNIDKDIFERYGFDQIIDSPVVEVSFNLRSVSVLLNPNIIVKKDGATYSFPQLQMDVSAEVLPLLDETDDVLNILDSIDITDLDQVPYDFLTYTPSSSSFKICGFSDNDGAYQVRIIYNAPFKAYRTVKFDFLTDVPLVDNSCTT